MGRSKTRTRLPAAEGRTVVAVIGGGDAGATAARCICAALTPEEASATHVVLINRSPMFLDRHVLHQVIGGVAATAERPLGPMLPDSSELVVGTVLLIDTVAMTLLIGSATGVRELRYDHVIYAAGRVPQVGPGGEGCAHVVVDTATADAASRAVELAAPRREILVIGDGMAGIEVVAAILHRHPGAAVTLTSPGQFLPSVRGSTRATIRRALNRSGVTVSPETSIAAVQPHCVILADTGEPMNAEVCIVTGEDTVADLARVSGLATDSAGRLLVDDHLRSLHHPEVVGAGFATAIVSTASGESRGGTPHAHGRQAAATVLAQIRGEQPGRPTPGYTVRALPLGHLGTFLEVASTRGLTELFGLRLPNRLIRWLTTAVLTDPRRPAGLELAPRELISNRGRHARAD